jgi:hypothetical protein
VRSKSQKDKKTKRQKDKKTKDKKRLASHEEISFGSFCWWWMVDAEVSRRR